MSLELLVGPPGSGKTQRLLELAELQLRQGRRVWWLGLPNQRSYLYRRATASGAVLGLEFQTLQQLYYRLLAHARKLQPLVIGTGRLALVGEALAREREAPPSPGEARLFTMGIAEAKRYGVSPAALPECDSETGRLRSIYCSYEQLKGDSWDYDDFRLQALRLAEAGEAKLECDLLIVDGFRELGPLDLRLLSALARGHEVYVALPETPAGYTATQVLGSTRESSRCYYFAANPVAEARWVLRSVKRDLAAGVDPLEIAVIVPRGGGEAVVALADEFGVPISDERPLALADTIPGRVLAGLLELPEQPTASRLLYVPQLSPLAGAVLNRGVVGRVGVRALARELDMEPVWDEWLAKLTPDGNLEAWAQHLIELALQFAGSRPHRAALSVDRFREQALGRAKEALRVAGAAGARAWWLALLKEAGVARVGPAGVALVDEVLISGRRFKRAYLTSATEGAYGGTEQEDYFIPEELRVDLEKLLTGVRNGLPRRFRSRNRLTFTELLTRAQELVVTIPKANQEGPLIAAGDLLAGRKTEPLPAVAAGSRLEIGEGRCEPVAAQIDGLLKARTPVELEDLRHFHQCSMRFWLEEVVSSGREGTHQTARSTVTGVNRSPAKGLPVGAGAWRELRGSLLSEGALSQERHQTLSASFPWAAAWLAEQGELLKELSLAVRFEVEPGVVTEIDGARREGDTALLYTFVPPGAVSSVEEAYDLVDERWSELWIAGHLLQSYGDAYKSVRIVVWPILSSPIEAIEGEITYPWRRIVERQEWARTAAKEYREARVKAKPGYQCSACQVRDICRFGAG